jgi:hypothetical protein
VLPYLRFDRDLFEDVDELLGGEMLGHPFPPRRFRRFFRAKKKSAFTVPAGIP